VMGILCDELHCLKAERLTKKNSTGLANKLTRMGGPFNLTRGLGLNQNSFWHEVHIFWISCKMSLLWLYTHFVVFLETVQCPTGSLALLRKERER